MSGDVGVTTRTEDTEALGYRSWLRGGSITVDCVGCSAMLANELEEKKRKGWMQGAPVVDGGVKSWRARKRRERTSGTSEQKRHFQFNTHYATTTSLLHLLLLVITCKGAMHVNQSTETTEKI